MKLQKALISVSDKTGIVEFARELEKMGIELISTGGTLKTIKDAGIQVTSVATFTGSLEILGGRVKTLHPKIHAGILYRRDNDGDIKQMKQSDYQGIDLVVCNLYPFEEKVADPNSDDDLIIENIDIGGPSMLRSAAKNHKYVSVVCDPDDYLSILEDLQKGGIDSKKRRQLAAKVFKMTAKYDAAIDSYFESNNLGN